MEIAKAKTKSVEVCALVLPPCSHCGQPYRPARPIEDHGVVFFQSGDWVANALYRVEKFVQRARKAWMGWA